MIKKELILIFTFAIVILSILAPLVTYLESKDEIIILEQNVKDLENEIFDLDMEVRIQLLDLKNKKEILEKCEASENLDYSNCNTKLLECREKKKERSNEESLLQECKLKTEEYTFCLSYARAMNSNNIAIERAALEADLKYIPPEDWKRIAPCSQFLDWEKLTNAVSTFHWINKNIKYQYTPLSIGVRNDNFMRSDLEVLELGAGQCNEISLLYISLLRAQGVYAVIGHINIPEPYCQDYQNNCYHAVVLVKIPGIENCPQLGRIEYHNFILVDPTISNKFGQPYYLDKLGEIDAIGVPQLKEHLKFIGNERAFSK